MRARLDPAVAALASPVSRADDRLLQLPDPIASILPGGLRRGSTVGIAPLCGGCSLALSLAASVTSVGGWVAAAGTPFLGLAAAAEMGVDLGRLALVDPSAKRWPEVLAALVDGFEMVVTNPPAQVRHTVARRLAARARERGSVMVILGTWPESPDVTLSVVRSRWEGLGSGHGHLAGRLVEVSVGGRRAARREGSAEMWLPAPSGVLCAAPAGTEAPPAGGVAGTAITGPAAVRAVGR